MADKVVITSAKQLDPKTYDDLKAKSKAQLQREIDERTMMLDDIKKEEARKEIAALVIEVNDAQDAFLKSMLFLNEHKLVPEATILAYTTEGGSFAPHLRHRHVDADRMLRIKAAAAAEAGDKVKKTRQARKPKA